MPDKSMQKVMSGVDKAADIQKRGDQIGAYELGKEDARKASPGQVKITTSGRDPGMPKSKKDLIGAYNKGYYDEASSFNMQKSDAQRTAVVEGDEIKRTNSGERNLLTRANRLRAAKGKK